MTKRIRIENADTTPHRVSVFVEDRDPDTGEWKRNCAPIPLNNPTEQMNDYIHQHRRLVVEEV